MALTKVTSNLTSFDSLLVDSDNTNTTITIESDLDGSSLFTSGIDLRRESVSKGSRIESLRDASAGGVGLNFLTTADNAAEVSGTLTSRMVILESGECGIGTSSPSKQLEIRNNTATSGQGGAELRLTRGDSSGAENDPIGTIDFYNTDADGAHVSSFIKGIAREQYARKGALTFGIATSTSTDAVELMRLSETNSLQLSAGVNLYSENLRSANNSVGTSYVNVLDFSGQGNAGRGFYLVSVIREGASVGTHAVVLVGLSSSSTLVLYETIKISGGISVNMSGANFQIKQTSGTSIMHATAIPIGIDGLDS